MAVRHCAGKIRGARGTSRHCSGPDPPTPQNCQHCHFCVGKDVDPCYLRCATAPVVVPVSCQGAPRPKPPPQGTTQRLACAAQTQTSPARRLSGSRGVPSSRQRTRASPLGRSCMPQPAMSSSSKELFLGRSESHGACVRASTSLWSGDGSAAPRPPCPRFPGCCAPRIPEHKNTRHARGRASHPNPLCPNPPPSRAPEPHQRSPPVFRAVFIQRSTAPRPAAAPLGAAWSSGRPEPKDRRAKSGKCHVHAPPSHAAARPRQRQPRPRWVRGGAAYTTLALAPASTSWVLAASASSLERPSFRTLGMVAVKSLTWFTAMLAMPRTTL